MLAKTWYREITGENLNLSDIEGAYRRLAFRVGKCEEDEAIQRAILRSLVGTTHVSLLNLTVKTHKDEGDVSTRPLHLMSRYKFNREV